MKQKFPLLNFIIVVFAFSPLALLAIIWKTLPQIVPIHYDAHFNPDKTGSKNILWLVHGMMAIIPLAVYFLLINLHRIDPKRIRQTSSISFKRIAIVTVLFVTILNFVALLSVSNYIKFSPKLLLVLTGLLIAFLGNYMNNLKPNYFAGIRLPWTLSSDDNWKRTHQFASKLWFWGGLLMVMLIILSPSVYSLQIFFAILGILIIIPVIYSYRLFKKEKLNHY